MQCLVLARYTQMIRKALEVFFLFDHIQGVPSICPQLWFQFLIFLIFLSKKTRFVIKTKMEKLSWGHLDTYKISKIEQFFLMSKKIVQNQKKILLRNFSRTVFTGCGFDFLPLHRGSSSICWVLVRDLAIDMHFFGVIGFLWMRSTSYDGPWTWQVPVLNIKPG